MVQGISYVGRINSHAENSGYEKLCMDGPAALHCFFVTLHNAFCRAAKAVSDLSGWVKYYGDSASPQTNQGNITISSLPPNPS